MTFLCLWGRRMFLANSCKNPQNPSWQQLEGSTSEATYGIPQLQTSCEALLRTQFRKKDSNQRSSPKTTHFEKNIQKKSEVFSCYMSPLNISKKLVDYHHFKAQKVIPRKKGDMNLANSGDNCMYPDPNVPLFWEISFCKPYITWLFYGCIIPKNCCREHQLNTKSGPHVR